MAVELCIEILIHNTRIVPMYKLTIGMPPLPWVEFTSKYQPSYLALQGVYHGILRTLGFQWGISITLQPWNIGSSRRLCCCLQDYIANNVQSQSISKVLHSDEFSLLNQVAKNIT